MPLSTFGDDESDAMVGLLGEFGFRKCTAECCKGRPHAVCKFCNCDRSTLNTVPHHEQRHRPWRRQRGLVCGICPWAIQSSDEYKDLDDCALLETIHRNTQSKRDYLTTVSAWEKSKLEQPGTRKRAFKPTVPTVAQARQTDMMQGAEQLGVLWPVAVYFRIYNKKPARKDLVTYPVNGKPVSGIIMPESEGLPIGSIKLEKVHQTASEKIGEMANSTTAVDDGEVNQAFETMVKRNRVTARVGKTKEGEVTCARLLCAGTRPEDGSSSGDEAMLDAVWGPTRIKNNTKRAASEDEDEDHEGDAQSKKKSSLRKVAPDESSEKSGKSGMPKPKPKPPLATPKKIKSTSEASPKPKAIPTGSAQATKDIEKSELAVFAAKQMKANLADSNLVGSITVAKLDDIISRLAARLSSNLVNLYSAGFVPSSSASSMEQQPESRGMKVLEGLRQQKADLELARPVVALMTKDPPEPASQLQEAHDKCVAAQIPLADKVRETMVCQSVQQAFASQDFEAGCKLLDFNASADGSVSVKLLDKEMAKAVQTVTVTKVITDMLRTTNQEQDGNYQVHIDFLVKLVKAVKGIDFIADNDNDTTKAELGNLHTVLAVHEATTDEDFEAIEGAIKTFNTKKSMMFHKPLTLFACGIAVMERASRVVAQHSRDNGLTTIMGEMRELCGNMATIDGNQFVSDTKFEVDPARWGDRIALRSKMEEVLANCSQAFKERHQAIFDAVHESQTKWATACLKGLFSYLDKPFTAAADEMLACAGPAPAPAEGVFALGDGECGQAVVEAWSASLAAMPDPSTFNLTALLQQSLVDRFLLATAHLKEVLGMLHQCAPAFYAICAKEEHGFKHYIDSGMHKLLELFATLKAVDSSDPVAFNIESLSQLQAMAQKITQCVVERISKDVAKAITPFSNFMKAVLGLADFPSKETVDGVCTREALCIDTVCAREAGHDIAGMATAFAKIGRDFLPNYPDGGDRAAGISMLTVEGTEVLIQEVLAIGIIIPAGICVIDAQAACHDGFLVKFSVLEGAVKDILPGAFQAVAVAQRRIGEGLEETTAKPFCCVAEMMEALLTDCAAKILDRLVRDSQECTGKMEKATKADIMVKFQGILESQQFPGPSADECKACYESEEARMLYTEMKRYETVDSQMDEVAKAFTAIGTSSAHTTATRNLLDVLGSKKGEFDQQELLIKKAGQLLGDLTGVQAGLRALGAGEDRCGLARRCRKGVTKRKHLSLSQKVDMWLSTLEAAHAGQA